MYVYKDWVLASLEAGCWVSEERYEMVTFSPAVRTIRLEKEATTGGVGEFKSELFRGEMMLMHTKIRIMKLLSNAF